jgi:hypothetical protein
MEKIELNSTICGFKVIEQSDALLKLQQKSYFWPIFLLCYAIIVCLIYYQVVVYKPLSPIGTIVNITLLFLLIGIPKRIGDTRFPSMICIRRSLVSLEYKKYLGGVREVSYQSDTIKSIQPGIFTGGRSSRISAVRICFINGSYVSLAFSSHLDMNIDKALEESSSFAEMFSSIMGVEVKSQYFDESALTSNSS